MSGEVIATNTGFNKNSSSSFAVGSSAYTYVQRFGRGNKGRMYGSPRSNIFTDDSFVMRVTDQIRKYQTCHRRHPR